MAAPVGVNRLAYPVPRHCSLGASQEALPVQGTPLPKAGAVPMAAAAHPLVYPGTCHCSLRATAAQDLDHRTEEFLGSTLARGQAAPQGVLLREGGTEERVALAVTSASPGVTSVERGRVQLAGRRGLGAGQNW